MKRLWEVEFDTRVVPGSQDQDYGYAQGMARAQEKVHTAITTAWEAQR